MQKEPKTNDNGPWTSVSAHSLRVISNSKKTLSMLEARGGKKAQKKTTTAKGVLALADAKR